jgi:hypothetical protein
MIVLVENKRCFLFNSRIIKMAHNQTSVIWRLYKDRTKTGTGPCCGLYWRGMRTNWSSSGPKTGILARVCLDLPLNHQ